MKPAPRNLTRISLRGAEVSFLQPEGPSTPNIMELDSKSHYRCGIWHLIPLYLGTWTLKLNAPRNRFVTPPYREHVKIIQLPISGARSAVKRCRYGGSQIERHGFEAWLACHIYLLLPDL